MNRADQRTIEAAARAWVECGGDAEGVIFCWPMLRDRVRELSQPAPDDDTLDETPHNTP